jgi:hypothetical protein
MLGWVDEVEADFVVMLAFSLAKLKRRFSPGRADDASAD